MKRIQLSWLLLGILIPTRLTAQDYQAALIPDSLKANAHCVVRESSRTLELTDFSRGTLHVRRVVTILGKEGEEDSEIVIPYDKDSKVSVREIVIYDAAGKKVRSIKQSEIADQPASGSSELYSDSRIKYFDANNPAYPYTLACEYEVTQQKMISYGIWRPVAGYNVSVMSSDFSIVYPKGLPVNIKRLNFEVSTPEVKTSESGASWEIRNFRAIEEEPMDVSIAERMPSVYLMPRQLQYDKYSGSAETWKEFGSWIYSLYEGRDQLSEAEKPKVTLLIRDITDTLERIRVLYKYMQNRTRYVAVTLGIGGFQPFDAKNVYATGYGDCKALTNYMYSLLRFAGIRSYPALVAAGPYKTAVCRDFPNFSQFNHVILCVPAGGDTTWLECTDQKIPFGFLGDFTDDRDVLLISAGGGVFAHTDRYSENLRTCRSEFVIDAKGTAVCSMRTIMTGLQFDNVSFLLSLGFEDQKKWLYGNSTLPSLQIKNFSIASRNTPNPELIISESSVSAGYCTFSGNYMILSLNMINVQKPLQKMTRKRYSDILVGRSFTDYDTLVFKIPAGYSYETLPKGNKIETAYGSYSLAVSGNESEITCIRRMSINEGRYEPSEYNRLYDFILAASKEDKSKVILVKK